MITFSRRKQDCLSKNDKSSIGEWDEPILKLCDKINKLENYYTLSSCSGRIVLIKNLEKKQPGMFIFRSHEKVSFEELQRILKEAEKNKETLIFKQEQPIIHVACENLKDSEKMLKKAQESGFKHSGIISILENRIVVEIIGSEQLALPILEKGKILVDNNFLEILLKESNRRLEKGWEKINKLEKSV
jgi:tRNA wybutosine-synthesizing protein 3